ncbi:MAG: Smr/MutS family protein [Rhodothermales bacterium]
MSFPKRFEDDGGTVTVDLHGSTVRDALYIARRCVQEGYRQGRSKVDVIHGASTSGRESRRTIKTALLDQLERGAFADWSSGHTTDASGGRTTVWLNIGPNADPARIRVNDVVPR